MRGFSITSALCLILDATDTMGANVHSTHLQRGVSPIIALFVLPSPESELLPGCGTDCEFVSAAYIKWLASAGARTYPISYNASPAEVRRVLDSVNGLLFTGGSVDESPGARWALEYAVALNRQGDYFPVWGSCLGWEWIAQGLAGNKQIISHGFDSCNMTHPLGLLPGAESSRVFSGFPAELVEQACVEPVTPHNHEKGVSPGAVTESGLNETLRILTVNHDRVGKAFVGMAEGIDMPIYGVQWHPEKVMFQWGADPDGTPMWAINHGDVAVKLSQHLASFFVSEARRNRHVLPEPAKWEPCMFHNLQTTPTGPRIDQTYEFFPMRNFDNTSCSPFTTKGRLRGAANVVPF